MTDESDTGDAALRAEIAKLGEEIVRLTQERDDALAEVDEMMQNWIDPDEAARLRHERDEARAAADPNQIEWLKSEIDDAVAKIETLTRERDEARGTIAMYDKDFEKFHQFEAKRVVEITDLLERAQKAERERDEKMR